MASRYWGPGIRGRLPDIRVSERPGPRCEKPDLRCREDRAQVLVGVKVPKGEGPGRPGESSTPVIMPGMHELRLPERFFQNLGEDEDLMEAEFTWKDMAAAETASLPQSPVGVCPSPTAMADTPGSQSEDHGPNRQDEVPSTSHDHEDASSSLQDALRVKNELVQFLLSRYLAREPITKAELLNSVLRDYQDHYVVILGQASEYLQLVFGLEVKEVDPSEYTYILVPTLGLTLNEMLRDEQRLPKAGLLVIVLCLIAVEVNSAPEEAIWGALSRIEVYPGSEHYIYGEPRELLTQVWVQEGYLEYRQVPDSNPARSEFLWGPRAYAETSKSEVLEYLDRVS
ncbi:melanoma-associated antigen 9-like [Bubalus kerabau]|uniref:melanoma-associated antigen 9-like n=2 Tax=Bubalus TaxID=9918 RepID=UPI00244EDA7D|nr:melanoma-associated antigen 9-like [Bubalus carabanensis]